MKFAFELLQHITRVINKVHFAEESLRSEKKENNESSYTALRLCLRLSCEIFRFFFLKKRKFNSHYQKLWERR